MRRIRRPGFRWAVLSNIKPKIKQPTDYTTETPLYSPDNSQNEIIRENKNTLLLTSINDTKCDFCGKEGKYKIKFLNSGRDYSVYCFDCIKKLTDSRINNILSVIILEKGDKEYFIAKQSLLERIRSAKGDNRKNTFESGQQLNFIGDKAIMETKKERFVKLAEIRTNKILDTVRLLGNLSNPYLYDYSKEDINKIFDAISIAVENCRKRFDGEKINNFKL